MAFDALQLLPLAAAFASGLASTYLLVGLHGLPPVRKTKLLARQLMHLAAADLTYAVFEFVILAVNIGAASGWTLEGVPETFKNYYCGAFTLFSNVGNEAALILECHLALTFAASICKSVSGLRTLSRCLPFVWVLALVLAIASPVLTKNSWAVPVPDVVQLTFGCNSATRDWIVLVSILTDFAACSVSYVLSSLHVFNAGFAVRHSIGARARTYLLAAVFANGPLAFYNSAPQSFFDTDGNKSRQQFLTAWFWTAVTLYNFSGLLHYAIYMIQCRSARRLVAGGELIGGHQQEHSFRVAFRSHHSSTSAPLVQQHVGSDTSGHIQVESDGSGGELAGQASYDVPSTYFVEEWSDISWFVNTEPVSVPLAPQRIEGQRTDGGQWSPSDFAGSSGLTGSSTPGGKG